MNNTIKSHKIIRFKIKNKSIYKKNQKIINKI